MNNEQSVVLPSSVCTRGGQTGAQKRLTEEILFGECEEGKMTTLQVKSIVASVLVAGMLVTLACARPAPPSPPEATPAQPAQAGETIPLPEPRLHGEMSVEEAIKGRRLERDFKDQPLNIEQVSQLLWAAQGITEDEGFKRATSSAGATYPLDVYLVVGENGVDGLQAGVYHYQVREHALRLLTGGDVRTALATACVSQMFIADAPITMVITAEYARTTERYRERGIRYVHTEVGHVGQNIYLQAEALGLGTVVIGAFTDEEVSRLLYLPGAYEPLYVMPVGYHH